MCDSFLALPVATRRRRTLIGKNSDRQRNEAQVVERLPRAQYESGADLSCTYLTIPQVPTTNAVLLSRPFWMWGAEMGANEHGVVIANEAIQAKTPAPAAKALLGMDLLRLALERATTARDAAAVIAELLERYGQGGDCGHLTPAFYNNAFLLADAEEAFVLETIDRDWVLEKATSVRAISNGFSIGHATENQSEGFRALLTAQGDESARIGSLVLADRQREHIGQADGRRQIATSRLESAIGALSLRDLMALARDHGPSQVGTTADPRFSQDYGLCVHATTDRRGAQTTGALISEIGAIEAVHWVTATSSPCLSIFKPMLIDAPVPFLAPRPRDRFDADTRWWAHERYHRGAMRGDMMRVLDEIADERDALETSFDGMIEAVVNGGDPGDRAHVVADCWRRADEVEARWHGAVPAGGPALPLDLIEIWNRFDAIAGLPVASPPPTCIS